MGALKMRLTYGLKLKLFYYYFPEILARVPNSIPLTRDRSFRQHPSWVEVNQACSMRAPAIKVEYVLILIINQSVSPNIRYIYTSIRILMEPPKCGGLGTCPRCPPLNRALHPYRTGFWNYEKANKAFTLNTLEIIIRHTSPYIFIVALKNH